MIEHKIWLKNKTYQEGIRGGTRVALMGYSHWDDEGDSEKKTEGTIAAVVEGKRSATFFTRIRDYLGFSEHADFWPRVLFFNYIPSFVGDGKRRFTNASAAQYEAAESRFLRIIDKHRPDLLIVFSSKAWERLPDGIQFAPDRLASGRFEYGYYDRDGHRTMVAMLRHPQGATTLKMVAAIDDAFEKCR